MAESHIGMRSNILNEREGEKLTFLLPNGIRREKNLDSKPNLVSAYLKLRHLSLFLFYT